MKCFGIPEKVFLPLGGMMKNALCNSRHRRTCRLAALMNVTLESVASCELPVAARDICAYT